MSWFAFFVFLLVVCNGQDIEPDIDEFIAAVLSCANIPGLTLTVVRDGEEYIAKGYGVSDIDSNESVNAQTLFLLASVSKAMSGVSMATVLREQDRDEVWWDSPVRDILGDEFYLNDDERTRHANLRDMFAHRLGIPRHDDMRLAGYSLEEFVSKLRFLEYNYDFRDRYRYQNIMYSAAELSAETMDGRSWQTIVRHNMFQPLGMESSTFISDEDAWNSMATGYYIDNGELRAVSKEVPKAYYTSFGMSGSIVSNAQDMGKYIIFQLNEGVAPDGTEILTPVQYRDTHVPLIQRTASPKWERPEYPVTYVPPSKYSTGWQESTYRDYALYQHTGSMGGYHAQLVIVPSLRHGVYIGINKSPDGGARDLIAMYILDLLLNEGPWLSVDSVCDHIDTRLKQEAHYPTHNLDVNLFLTKARDKLSRSKNQDVVRSVDHSGLIDEYEGLYGEYAYGNITIAVDGDTGGLTMQYGLENFTWDLTETEPSVFQGVGREPLWYHHVTLYFELDGATASAVTVSFEEDDPPRFIRDLDFNNPPPPPELCE